LTAETLASWQDPTRPGRVLAAARLGNIRLIDNLPLR
jgi:pantothenate synthetase